MFLLWATLEQNPIVGLLKNCELSKNIYEKTEIILTNRPERVARSSWRVRMPDSAVFLDIYDVRNLTSKELSLIYWHAGKQNSNICCLYMHRRDHRHGAWLVEFWTKKHRRDSRHRANIRHLDKETHQPDILHLKSSLGTHILRGQRGDWYSDSTQRFLSRTWGTFIAFLR